MSSFQVLYLFIQIVGLTSVVLTIVWVSVYLNLVLEISNIKLFNWHPILMVLSMIYLQGNCELFSGKCLGTKEATDSKPNFNFPPLQPFYSSEFSRIHLD
jgi:hypothetical protein